MNITLGQDLASIVRYIQDNAVEGTKLYFDEIPEDFYVPSVYFQTPFTSGRKATLRSYGTTMTMNIWFMESKDWDANVKAVGMMEGIMLNNCEIPIVNVDGEKIERVLRITEPGTRKIDEGIVQLTFSFETFFHVEKETTKMKKFYLEWQKVKEMVTNRR